MRRRQLSTQNTWLYNQCVCIYQMPLILLLRKCCCLLLQRPLSKAGQKTTASCISLQTFGLL